MADVYYVVQVFRRWNTLAAGPFALAEPQEGGCVGFLPIFASIAEAVAWKDENHPTAGIVAMTEGIEEEAVAVG